MTTMDITTSSIAFRGGKEQKVLEASRKAAEHLRRTQLPKEVQVEQMVRDTAPNMNKVNNFFKNYATDVRSSYQELKETVNDLKRVRQESPYHQISEAQSADLTIKIGNLLKSICGIK